MTNPIVLTELNKKRFILNTYSKLPIKGAIEVFNLSGPQPLAAPFGLELAHQSCGVDPEVIKNKVMEWNGVKIIPVTKPTPNNPSSNEVLTYFIACGNFTPQQASSVITSMQSDITVYGLGYKMTDKGIDHLTEQDRYGIFAAYLQIKLPSLTGKRIIKIAPNGDIKDPYVSP